MDTARLLKFENQLRPFFASLPKNQHGNLESPAVRYALHRYFVHRHGWYVVGLEPLGQAWNASSPASVVKSKIPAYLQSIFDRRLHGQGMDLRDLAAFAATLFDFMHNEIVSDVMDIYSALNLPTTAPVTKAEADRILKAYTLQILDGTLTATSWDHVDEMEKDLKDWFPLYDEFQMWVDDVRQTISMDRHRHSMQVDEMSLDKIVDVVLEVNDRLGAFQNLECRSLKAGLMDMEFEGTGRVFLSDFYRAGLKGDFLFVEHIDFLRKLGALDEESYPGHPTIVIANYLTGKANCLTETNFHSVCCYDECQGLLAHLEDAIATPMAAPSRIVELVEQLPSDTVDAPRNLSSSLVARLEQVAAHHDGLVPLHGRFFAQWMHHAYPLECPYPHAGGTTSPLTQDEYLDLTGAKDVTLSQEERSRYSMLSKPQEELGELPWLHVEDLVTSHQGKAQTPGSYTLRKVAAFSALTATAVSLVGMAVRALGPLEGKPVEYAV